MKLATAKTLIALLILFFFTFQPHAYGQSGTTAFPRLQPDQRALDYYNLGKQRGYTWTELAEMSLWASGDSSLSGMDNIRAAVAALHNESGFPAAGRERAEFILTFIHSNILRSYSIYQTRIDTVFTNGLYNCVSSAVLYMILCESAGISTSAVITREHAFVMVHINGEDIDVETTNRFGFDPGNRREFHDQFGRLTGFTYVPVQNYRDRLTIGKIELISLILNNRISDTERQNRFAESVPLAIDRAALLLGDLTNITTGVGSNASLFEDPRKDLIDRLFNYGAMLLRTNREEDCLLWAITASGFFPDPPQNELSSPANSQRWQEFILAAINNRVTKFLRENRTGEARNFLEGHKSLLTDANYAQLDTVVLDAELSRRANLINTADEGDRVILEIEQSRIEGRIAERRALELLTFAIQKTAAALCAPPARDWRAAIVYLENALVRFGANRELQQTLATYRSNLAIDYHNRFAAEWNRRNYDEAERILNEGLAEFPIDRQLLSDREIVERQRNR